MRDMILQIVNEKHKESGGKCGTYFAEFVIKLKVSSIEFEELISEMYNNNEIKIREGINGFLVTKRQK